MHDGIASVAGGEQDGQIRIDLPDLVGEHPPIRLAENDVGEQEADVRLLGHGAERFLHIGGVNHAIAELKQDVSRVFAHSLAVLHQ